MADEAIEDPSTADETLVDQSSQISRHNPAPNRDELVALGLLDLTEPDALDREALLQFVLARGATLDDLEHSRDLGRMVGASVEQMLRPGPRLSRREIAWRTAIDDDVLVRMRQAAGLSDPGIDAACFTESDVLAARAFERLALLFGEPVAMELMRVVGGALARIAEAALSAYVVNVAAPLRHLAASSSDANEHHASTGRAPKVDVDLTTARAFTEVAAALPDLGRSLDTLLRHHLDAAMQQLAVTQHGSIDSDVVSLTVGFVDLVGSTAWARALPVHDLAAALSRFAALANEVASNRGARVVKLIGDEVMFVAGNAADACTIAIELVEGCGSDAELPPLRGGIATGEVVARDGDYHGAIVHLASRIVKEAEPYTVVVDRATARSAGRGDHRLAFRTAGARVLRGFDEPVELVGVSPRETPAAVA